MTDVIAEARALIEPLTGHTPGEWEMSVTHPTNACANVRCGYTDVATLYGGDSDVSQPADDEPWGPQPIRDANARLTAAAPALRDTVADLADLAEVQAQRIEKLEAALRLHKAWSDSEAAGPDYGEQNRDTHPDGDRIWRQWWDGNLDLCARAQAATNAALGETQ